MSTNGNSRKFLNRTGPDGGGRGQSRSNRPGCRLFGTVSKDRGASISSCHAPEAVCAPGANPIQLEQIRVTGLVQVRRSFFHHHGFRRRLYQARVRAVVMRIGLFATTGNFPNRISRLGFGRAPRSMESGCRRHFAQLDSQKKRGLEPSSVAEDERDIFQKSSTPANESGLRSRRGRTLSVSG